ncbi:DUF1028 domain-containing protein [Halomonas koreensis]|uniref:DUF1028 domain-containing protein n=1 Tax=Halomonas koreensis TaxID=245385 RepID=A0ABU1FY25_9GAMM|nr:DUF1028 domain-containing protein [Halomonas koreensis]MDR5865381.1 DUF1028 domain-containing protein [Halomonas koreensis]
MTFSLIALAPDRRTLGVACATGGPALGGFVPHLQAGVGAAVTQGYSTSVMAAERGLGRLAAGEAVTPAVAELRRADRGEAWRQLALMDSRGEVAGWTGAHNVPVCDLHLEPGLAVAGNMLGSDEVVPAMIEAYRQANASGEALAEALLAALVAGQQAGGDRRGLVSAALKVRAPGGLPLDLRIDHSSEAVTALNELHRRLQADSDFQAFLSRLPTEEAPGRY